MSINPIFVIKKIKLKLDLIKNGLSTEQLQHYQSSFDSMQQDLDLINQVEQGNKASIDWRQYSRICWNIFDKLVAIDSHMNKDFLHQNQANFLQVYKSLFNLVDNQYSLELDQMHQYYAKLSDSNKAKVDSIDSYLESVDAIRESLTQLLASLTLIDKKDELIANVNYLKVLSELIQLRTSLDCEKLSVYDEESFIPDEVPNDSLKEKDQ